MGTSKGYIAPTTPNWSQAKRAVTSFAKNGDHASKANAASKYASAVKADMSTLNTFNSATSRVLGFAQSVASKGLDDALRDYNREDLIGKPSDVVWSELLNDFTNAGATTEDNIAADALSQGLANLEIDDISKIGDISTEALLKEMLKEYIKAHFDFCYEEKISKGRSPMQTAEVLNKMHEYIENSIDGDLNLSMIKTVNFADIKSSDVVKNALYDAYSIFERYYEEE